MSTVNSFDKNLHFSELNSPLFGGNPTPLSPAARKVLARTNLGVFAAGDGVSGARFSGTPLVNTTVTAVNTSATLTAAQILGGQITSTTAAAVAMTLPTGALFEAALIAQYPNLQNGDMFEFFVSNLGATQVITFVAGSSFTLSSATPSVAANNGITCLARRTSAGVYVLYFS